MESHPNWKALASVSFPYKPFIQERRFCSNFHDTRVKLKGSISGYDSRAAYEEVLAFPSEGKKQHCPENQNVVESVSRKSPKYKLDRSNWVNALMKEASANNVEGIKKHFGESKEVNVMDQFGWTMLMCAAHAGASEVVKYLLEIGADIRIRDKGGNTCISLAKRQKHFAILDLFKNCSVIKSAKSDDKNQVSRIFCELCKQQFEETPNRLHKNSTVHLFNSHPRKNVTWYGIPDSNMGFKLMVKSGWNREEGLGPDGAGSKFPPKTVLKRDRHGLGVHSGVARVTHFKPNDARAIKLKNMNMTQPNREQKKSIQSQYSSERRKERFLRRELNF